MLFLSVWIGLFQVRWNLHMLRTLSHPVYSGLVMVSKSTMQINNYEEDMVNEQ